MDFTITNLQIDVSQCQHDWELYDMPGAECVAYKLNDAATLALNEAISIYNKTRDIKAATDAAWAIWKPVSDSNGYFGASDTEPRFHFQSMLDRVLKMVHYKGDKF